MCFCRRCFLRRQRCSFCVYIAFLQLLITNILASGTGILAAALRFWKLRFSEVSSVMKLGRNKTLHLSVHPLLGFSPGYTSVWQPACVTSFCTFPIDVPQSVSCHFFPRFQSEDESTLRFRNTSQGQTVKTRPILQVVEQFGAYFKCPFWEHYTCCNSKVAVVLEFSAPIEVKISFVIPFHMRDHAWPIQLNTTSNRKIGSQQQPWWNVEWCGQ